jgi:hypothetical protein
MEPLSPEGLKIVNELAQSYSVSNQAVTTLLQALVAGNGTMAQFNHPELGGPGQWSQGGMIMIGDMFNNALKAKVDGLCSELANRLRHAGLFVPATPGSWGAWWGVDLGPAGASGSQNNIRYAYFPAAQRLAVGTGDRVTIYDSADHQINGISQQQGGSSSLTFVSQHRLVPLADLQVVSGEPAAKRTAPGSKSETPVQSDDVFFKLERLAEIHAKGIISDEEFAQKKADLLGRI